jgi:hypothetical protein
MRRHSPAVFAIVVVLTLLLVVYVLAIGPINWLIAKSYLNGTTHDIVGRAYSPLSFLAEKSPTLELLVDLYVNLWVPEERQRTIPGW